MCINKLKVIAQPLMSLKVTSNTQYFMCCLNVLQLYNYVYNNKNFTKKDVNP